MAEQEPTAHGHPAIPAPDDLAVIPLLAELRRTIREQRAMIAIRLNTYSFASRFSLVQSRSPVRNG